MRLGSDVASSKMPHLSEGFRSRKETKPPSLAVNESDPFLDVIQLIYFRFNYM